jgi:hypothetical protein
VSPPALAGAESPVSIARRRRPVTCHDVSMRVLASPPLGRSASNAHPSRGLPFSISGLSVGNAFKTLSCLHPLSPVPSRPHRLLDTSPGHVPRFLDARACVTTSRLIGFERSLLSKLAVQHHRPLGRTTPARHSRVCTDSRRCRVAHIDCSIRRPVATRLCDPR